MELSLQLRSLTLAVVQAVALHGGGIVAAGYRVDVLLIFKLQTEHLVAIKLERLVAGIAAACQVAHGGFKLGGRRFCIGSAVG